MRIFAVAILGIALLCLVEDTKTQGGLDTLLNPILTSVNLLTSTLLTTVNSLTSSLSFFGLNDSLTNLIHSTTTTVTKTTDTLVDNVVNILNNPKNPLGPLLGGAGGLVGSLLEAVAGLLTNLAGGLLNLAGGLAGLPGGGDAISGLLGSITGTVDGLLKNVGKITGTQLVLVSHTLEDKNTSASQLTSTAIPLLNALNHSVSRLDGITDQLLQMAPTSATQKTQINDLLKNISVTLNSISSEVSQLQSKSSRSDLLNGDVGLKLKDISSNVQKSLQKINQHNFGKL